MTAGTGVVIDNGSEDVGQWRPTAPAFAPAQGGQYATVTAFCDDQPGSVLAAASAPI